MAGLEGADYTRHSRSDATRDDGGSRWVAVDESGWDGEQLYGRASRYLVLGSVAIDDATAAPIVDDLRHRSGVLQPPELKASQFTRSRDSRRLDALADLLALSGPLTDRTSVYMLDKHYFIAGKIIDLLLEEHANQHGVNLYEGGIARELARTLFNEGPRALGKDGFESLIKTMVDFASMRNQHAAQVSVDMLFNEIDNAWARSTRRNVTSILLRLRDTRSVANAFIQSLRSVSIQSMEPLIPSLASIIEVWSNRVGRVRILVDEQRVYTDSVLDDVLKIATFELGPRGRFVQVPGHRTTRTIVRGTSTAHTSIQLADLVAGAGQAIALRHIGQPSPAGEQLWRTVVPLITVRSMVAHDEPDRFARTTA
jgi:hypothetical protein